MLLSRIQYAGLELYRLTRLESKECIRLFTNIRLYSTTDEGDKSASSQVNAEENEKMVKKECKESDSKRNEVAKKKLFSLLSDMTNNFPASSRSSTVQLAKPAPHPKIKDKTETDKKFSKTSEEMMNAVKGVASLAGSEGEKIKTELLESIKSISTIEEVDEQALEAETPEIATELGDDVMQDMASAVEAVATSASGEPFQPTQSELTKKLLSLAADPSTESIENNKIKQIFRGMRIEQRKVEHLKDPEWGISKYKTDYHRETGKSVARSSPPVVEEEIDLFNDVPLNIFADSAKERESSSVLWRKMQEKELKSLVTFAPTNAFQEMIQLTEQGKHWKFPIDNFSEIGPEEHVGFHEHVFLERHLHGFPSKGPIRHFMELVCVGLSKNPYITVDRKIQNIDWYREYFKEKEHILKEYGVLDEQQN